MGGVPTTPCSHTLALNIAKLKKRTINLSIGLLERQTLFGQMCCQRCLLLARRYKLRIRCLMRCKDSVARRDSILMSSLSRAPPIIKTNTRGTRLILAPTNSCNQRIQDCQSTTEKKNTLRYILC